MVPFSEDASDVFTMSPFQFMKEYWVKTVFNCTNPHIFSQYTIRVVCRNLLGKGALVQSSVFGTLVFP